MEGGGARRQMVTLTVGDWGEFENRVERTLQVGQLI